MAEGRRHTISQEAKKDTGNALDALDPVARENFIRASYVFVRRFLAQPGSREMLDAYKQKLIAEGRWPLKRDIDNNIADDPSQ